jgi:hypothetical protein
MGSRQNIVNWHKIISPGVAVIRAAILPFMENSNPMDKNDTILLAHGSGGKAAKESQQK